MRRGPWAIGQRAPLLKVAWLLHCGAATRGHGADGSQWSGQRVQLAHVLEPCFVDELRKKSGEMVARRFEPIEQLNGKK